MIPDTLSAPYYDDYNPEKNFHKILFKPGVPVQTRELNQLQTILQKQIERFGNKVLKQGTIVSGCQLTPAPAVPYVKIRDRQANGRVVDLSVMDQLYVKNSANTIGIILTTTNGYESTAPDLNTLYVRYLNSGTDGVSASFNANETLTVYNPAGTIENVVTTNGSAGFVTGDSVEFLSAVRVSNSTGGDIFTAGLNVGDIISDGAGANVAISRIQTVGGKTVLNLRPRSADTTTNNYVAWNVQAGSVFADANTGQTLQIQEVFGSGAKGTVEVNGIGEVKTVTMTAKGTGYTILPTSFVVSETATVAQSDALQLSPENFVAQIVVGNELLSPINKAYGLTIEEGVVYQQGYFTRVDRQFLIVSKYDTTPSGVVVGFDTSGEIVTYKTDDSLLDNQFGTPNYLAPGADRLKVTAKAIVLTKEEAASRADFLAILEFSEGEPFKQEDQTQSELLDSYIAQRTFEESGNFVIDPFIVNTKSAPIGESNLSLRVAVDPGTAYINGYRVSTQRNYFESIDKGIAYKSLTSIPSSANYGNYVIGDVMGAFAVGDAVSLRSGSYSGTPGDTIIAPGTGIGSARIRGILRDGSSYRIYLFDVKMNAGQNFGSVLALFKTGGVINIAPVLYNATNGQSIFNAPVNAIKNISNVSYQYQKSNWGSIAANTSGFITLTTSASEEKFPVAGALGIDDISKIFVVPSANLVSSAALTGTVATSSGSNTITGSGTDFVSSLRAGQFIQVSNATASEIAKVTSIVNATSATVASSFLTTFASGSALKKAFPAGIPAAISSANVSVDRNTLTINLGTATNSANVQVLTNVVRTPTVAAKAVTRNAAVRLNLATHPSSTSGPWALGLSDVVHLRGVYRGSNTTFTASQGVDITNHFYIDANHTPDYAGTSYLYKKPSSSLTLSASDRLLTLFDVLTKSGSEVVTLASYPVNDVVTLANSGTTINTLEIPEIYGTGDRYFDARDCYDFRPSFANTIAITTTQATAPVNPTEPSYDNRYASIGPIPAPESSIAANIDYYLGRYDRVIVTASGDIKVLSGTAGTDIVPAAPDKSITINTLRVPPYPSIANSLDDDMSAFAQTGIASERFAARRIGSYRVSATYTPAQINAQQPKGYTMTEIGSLDRRLSSVEYYLALSMAELNTGKRSIQSANDNTDRFKFGFFTDSFADSSFSDVTNPQYTASIAENVVAPVQSRFTVALSPLDDDLSTGGLLATAYNDYRLLGQSLATDGAVQAPASTPTTPNTPTSPSVTQRIERTYVVNLNTNTSKQGLVSETREFFLSSLPGSCELYFNFRDNDYGIEIYQGFNSGFTYSQGRLIKDGLAAIRLTAAEESDPNKAGAMHTKNETLNTVPVLLAGFWTREDSGKITFDYDPANGRYILIRVIKIRHSGAASTKGKFSYRFVYPVDNEVVYVVPSIPATIDYTGVFTSVSPDPFYTMPIDTSTALSYYMPSQAIEAVVEGLKPTTVHSFTIGGEDKTQFCQPAGGALGDDLITDASGKLTFIFWYQLSTAISNQTVNEPASKKSLVISDGDQSTASYVINVKPYVARPAISTGGGGGAGSSSREFGSNQYVQQV